jgi:hypothetical protein
LCIVCRPSGVSVLRRMYLGINFSFAITADPSR